MKALTDLVACLRLLCKPPAAGWATSSAGSAPLAHACHERRFQTTEPLSVNKIHWEAVERLLPTATAAVVGIPFDGASFGYRGAASGPTGLRTVWDPISGVTDCGDIDVVPQLFQDEFLSATVLTELRQARFGSGASTMPVSALTTARFLAELFACAGIPLVVIGGDHSISAPLIAAIRSAPFGLLHFDGHDDLGVARNGINLAHSSWIHDLERKQSAPSQIFQIGMPHNLARGKWLGDRLTRIEALSNPRSVENAALGIAHTCAALGLNGLYVSIDVDCVDKSFAPGTNLPNENGLSIDQIQSLIERVAEFVPIIGGDVVEVAPILSGSRDWTSDETSLTAAALIDCLCRSIRPRRSSS